MITETAQRRLLMNTNAAWCFPQALTADPHYQAVSFHYGDRTARRSGVLLINHINEGLCILNAIAATQAAMQAYCLHPLFQGDQELREVRPEMLQRFSPRALLLVMEYRSVANAYLSERQINRIEEIRLSPLEEVQYMLIADKIQNRKDFERYHKPFHPRSIELELYFRN